MKEEERQETRALKPPPKDPMKEEPRLVRVRARARVRARVRIRVSNQGKGRCGSGSGSGVWIGA